MSKSIEEDEQPGIELHQLPKKWKWSCLGDLGIVRLGKTPRKSDYQDDGDYKIVKFRDVDQSGSIDWDNNEKGYVSSSPEVLGALQELREGDVLVTASAHMSGHIGKKVGLVFSIPRKYKHTFVVGELLLIRTKDGVDPRWVFYFLGSTDGYKAIQRRVHGVHLIGSRAQHIEIPLAPPDDQQRIVAEIEKQFSRLDEAVANLRRVKANLKRYKASVLKAAVEGKLTKGWRKQHPNVEPASKFLERILAERRAKWSGRGKYKEPAKPVITEPLLLPEKWIWTTVEQLTAMVTSGSRGWGEYYSNTGSLFIRAQDIKTDSLNLPNVARVMIPHNAEGTRTAVSKGDVLITITGANVTKSALVRELKEEAFVSQHVALLKPCLTAISTYLFTWVVAPTHGRKTLERWAYGAGKPGLSLEQVRSLPVALPPLAEQEQIVAEVERRLSIIDELEATLKRSDRLRQSILSEAFAGKLVCANGNQSDKRSTDIQMAKA